MLLPELVYNVRSAVDLSEIAGQFVFDSVTDSGASTNIAERVFIVPGNRICVVQTFTARGAAGAGQNTIEVRLLMEDIGVRDIVIAHVRGNAGVLLADWQGGEVWLPPNYALTVRVLFDAAVAVNSIEGSFTGWTIPLGNLRR